MTACKIKPTKLAENNNRLIQNAIEYAELGLKVISIQGKKSFMQRWPKRATRCPETILRWYRSWPEANLGIATGDGLIAVDVDPRNGGDESLKKLKQGRKFPRTAEAVTGSGGSHYLFRVDPNLQIGNGDPLPGIDLKGKGGLIAVEPSVHPGTKKEYVWLRHPRQGIAEAPGWLVELLMPYARKRSPFARTGGAPSLTRGGDEGRELAVLIERFAVTAIGQRNDQMVKAVARLVGREHKPEFIHAVVGAWWHHFYNLGVVGTHPDEAAHSIESCINSIQNSPTFQKAIAIDHRAAIQQVKLTQHQQHLIDTILNPTALSKTPPHSNRVTRSKIVPIRRHDREFVEALAIYFTYKVSSVGESPLEVRATNSQIGDVVADRHGINLKNPQLERLVQRFVSRDGKPATTYELAIQTSKGRQGVASVYELTGLLPILPPEALGSPLSRPGG